MNIMKLIFDKTKKKRILMLLQNGPYPWDPRVRNEATVLVSAGYNVSVIAPLLRGQPWHEIIGGVHVYRFPAPPSGDGFFGYIKEYVYSMAAIFIVSQFVFFREGFDIVHSHHPPDLFVFITTFYKLLGKRVVIDHHDLAPELYYARFSGRGNRLVYRLLVWLEKAALRHADRVIATNQSYKEIEMRRGNVPEHRISIVRNGAGVNQLESGESFSNVIQKGKTILGYIGVIGKQDGLDYLMRALRHLVYDLNHRSFICVIVGGGVGLSELKAMAINMNVNEYVLFRGWVFKQSSLARDLNSMDICLAPEPSNPYNNHSTAIKIMDYMAFGKPIVAFDIPEHRFSARSAAIYAKPNDEYDFAQKISALINDPQQRYEMGKIGIKRIKEELGWHIQSKYLLEAYESLFK